MEHFLAAIPQNFSYLADYRYGLLFLGTLLEGMNTIILAGFLTSIGELKSIYVIPLMILAHVINGYLWYLVGYYGGSKVLDFWTRRSEKNLVVVNKVWEYFKKYSGRAIIFAKFTFSLEIITMILSGMLKYPMRLFSRYNLIGSIGWVFMAFGVGFFFGKSFIFSFQLISSATWFLIFLLFAIGLIYLIKYLLKRYYLDYIDVQRRLRDIGERIKNGLDEIFSEGEK